MPVAQGWRRRKSHSSVSTALGRWWMMKRASRITSYNVCYTKLLRDEIQRDTSANWETYQKALFNLKFVENDGTHGVHNPDYSQAVLKSVEADFKQVMKNLNRTW